MPNIVSRASCAGLVLVSLLTLTQIGCGGVTQMNDSNRQLLGAVQTAVSSKKTEWLDASAKTLAEKREKKEVSAAEFAALDAIIQKAKSGDWKTAQKEVVALIDGQKPTAADQSKLQQRKSRE